MPRASQQRQRRQLFECVRGTSTGPLSRALTAVPRARIGRSLLQVHGGRGRAWQRDLLPKRRHGGFISAVREQHHRQVDYLLIALELPLMTSDDL